MLAKVFCVCVHVVVWAIHSPKLRLLTGQGKQQGAS